MLLSLLLFSVTKSHPTFCNHMDWSSPGSSVLHFLPEFLSFMPIEWVMLSHHLILCKYDSSCKKWKAILNHKTYVKYMFIFSLCDESPFLFFYFHLGLLFPRLAIKLGLRGWGNCFVIYVFILLLFPGFLPPDAQVLFLKS